MNLELALYLLSGAGVFIMTLFTIIGFGLKRFAIRFDSFALTMEGIKLSLEAVVNRLTIQETRAAASKETCKEKHALINKEFEELEDITQRHEKEITIIKEKLK